MMRRDEATMLIGKPVAIWTAFWGCYVAELLGITDTKPFRAQVKILSVLKAPTDGLKPGGGPLWKHRAAFDEWFVTTVGCANVQAYTEEIVPYQESLIAALRAQIAQIERHREQREEWWQLRVLEGLQQELDSVLKGSAS